VTCLPLINETAASIAATVSIPEQESVALSTDYGISSPFHLVRCLCTGFNSLKTSRAIFNISFLSVYAQGASCLALLTDPLGYWAILGPTMTGQP